MKFPQNNRSHGHTHGAMHPAILTTQRGIWAIKWSFWVASNRPLSGCSSSLFQEVWRFLQTRSIILVMLLRQSHWGLLSCWQVASHKRFTYGYGRVEDLAGVAIVIIITFSAATAGYQSANRLFHPQAVGHLWAVIVASVVGFLVNEAVAIFRIRIGKVISSAALITDGYHARVDGLTSLAVLWCGGSLARIFHCTSYHRSSYYRCYIPHRMAI